MVELYPDLNKRGRRFRFGGEFDPLRLLDGDEHERLVSWRALPGSKVGGGLHQFVLPNGECQYFHLHGLPRNWRVVGDEPWDEVPQRFDELQV